MSLGIAFKGPEGIVLAADSRVTLNAEMRQPNGGRVVIPATFDNATKLLKVKGQRYVGAVTYGLGAIGQREPRTAHSFIPEFEEELKLSLEDKDEKRVGVEAFAEKLSTFFRDQWSEMMPSTYQGPDMIFLVGGLDRGDAYGKVFEFAIPSHPTPVEQHAGEGVFGISWGGQLGFTQRLINGYDLELLHITQQELGLSEEQVSSLRERYKQLSLRIPYQFLPLQDCVDLSIFLIRTTIELQTWQVGIRGVGGAIDVATITRTDGLVSVQQKEVVGERRE